MNERQIQLPTPEGGLETYTLSGTAVPAAPRPQPQQGHGKQPQPTVANPLCRHWQQGLGNVGSVSWERHSPAPGDGHTWPGGVQAASGATSVMPLRQLQFNSRSVAAHGAAAIAQIVGFLTTHNSVDEPS